MFKHFSASGTLLSSICTLLKKMLHTFQHFFACETLSVQLLNSRKFVKPQVGISAEETRSTDTTAPTGNELVSSRLQGQQQLHAWRWANSSSSVKCAND